MIFAAGGITVSWADSVLACVLETALELVFEFTFEFALVELEPLLVPPLPLPPPPPPPHAVRARLPAPASRLAINFRRVAGELANSEIRSCSADCSRKREEFLPVWFLHLSDNMPLFPQ
jgi:hypothetical protein